MKTNTNNTDARLWLEAVESFAVRHDDAALALEALRLRAHPALHAVVGGVLGELARRARELAVVVMECGKRTSATVATEGGELAALLASGWAVLAGIEREGGSTPGSR